MQALSKLELNGLLSSLKTTKHQQCGVKAWKIWSSTAGTTRTQVSSESSRDTWVHGTSTAFLQPGRSRRSGELTQTQQEAQQVCTYVHAPAVPCAHAAERSPPLQGKWGDWRCAALPLRPCSVLRTPVMASTAFHAAALVAASCVVLMQEQRGLDRNSKGCTQHARATSSPFNHAHSPGACIGIMRQHTSEASLKLRVVGLHTLQKLLHTARKRHAMQRSDAVAVAAWLQPLGCGAHSGASGTSKAHSCKVQAVPSTPKDWRAQSAARPPVPSAASRAHEAHKAGVAHLQPRTRAMLLHSLARVAQAKQGWDKFVHSPAPSQLFHRVALQLGHETQQMDAQVWCWHNVDCALCMCHAKGTLKDACFARAWYACCSRRTLRSFTRLTNARCAGSCQHAVGLREAAATRWSPHRWPEPCNRATQRLSGCTSACHLHVGSSQA